MGSNDPPPEDPREVLRQNRDAAQDRERLSDDHKIWLRGAIRNRAHRYKIEADELRQELELSLLCRSMTVDEGNPGVRGWLWRRVTWTAQDMSRRRNREIPVDPAELKSAEACPDDAGERQIPLAELTQRVLWNFVRLGLTPNEAQTVALLCAGIDMPLNQFAIRVGRSHDSVRQERSRGLRKIENYLDLSAEDDEVLRYWREFGSARAAAPYLNRSEDDIHRIVDDLHKKIDQIFGEKEV